MESSKRNKIVVMTGVLLALLLSSLDQTIVATAMPDIVGDLNGLSHLSWVFTAYMLATTVTVPVYGKLSDIFGRRNLYLVGIAIFLLGSVLCGMSQSMLQLILFRGLQGVGGGAMMVNSFAIIGDIFPPAERGKWQGVIGAVFGLSSIAGPLLGGILTDALSWRWVFYVNLPLGILAMIVLATALPKIKRDKDRKIDYQGAFLLSLSLMPLLLALVWGGGTYAWGSWQVISLLCLFAVATLLFIRREQRATEPILDLKLFRNRTFIVSILGLFLVAMAMYGAILYIPIFSQSIIGVSATRAGFILTPMMLSMVVASTLSGQVISRTGRYKFLMIGGVAMATVALVLFSKVGLHTSTTSLTLRMLLLGLGLGCTLPIFTIAVQNAFPNERLGEVTAGTQLFRSIGGSVGTAVLGGLMNLKLKSWLPAIQNEPFTESLKTLRPELATVTTDNVQQMLNPGVMQQVSAKIAGQPALQAHFDSYLIALKTAFSQAVDLVFVATAVVMAICFIVVFFMPEVPLRRGHEPALQEMGQDLKAEWANTDKRGADRDN